VFQKELKNLVSNFNEANRKLRIENGSEKLLKNLENHRHEQKKPSNRVISSSEGKFVTVGATFVPVINRSFLKISNLCKNIL
jgi:hypothetical protein